MHVLLHNRNSNTYNTRSLLLRPLHVVFPHTHHKYFFIPPFFRLLYSKYAPTVTA
jgi:hypothetical protein